MKVLTETGADITVQAPRCANCGHVPLTLLAFDSNQMVRARLGCRCRSAILYDRSLQGQLSGEGQVPVEQDPLAPLQLSLKHRGSMHVQ